jgi:hypothetical protein
MAKATITVPTLSGKAPGPGARMATKPSGGGGSPKQGSIMAGSSSPATTRGGPTPPPKPSATKKGSNGQFTHPKGNY